jgi:uncharacterized membrane protein
MHRTLAILILLFVVEPAMAYIGPGSGLSLLGSLWSIVLGVVLVLFAIIAWPLRRLLRRIRARKAGGNDVPR